MLLKPFYNVYVAESGQGALELVREREIDLVTLDLKMPGIQGTEVLKQIKAIRRDIEIIIITGYGNLKSAIDGIRLSGPRFGGGVCDDHRKKRRNSDALRKEGIMSPVPYLLWAGLVLGYLSIERYLVMPKRFFLYYIILASLALFATALP